MRIPKSVQNVMISVGVLLVVFVGGGVGYTWYVGQSQEDVLAVTTPVEAPATVPLVRKPVQPAANTPVSATVQSLTSPVAPGWNASVTVKTKPTSECTIKVVYGEVESNDSGLGLKTADDYGMVSWTWTIDETAAIGTWPVEATCVSGEKSAFVRAYLDVVMEKEQE